jgi:C1A family cysteine protease
MPIDISQFGKGCIKQPTDLRDYKYQPSLGAVMLPDSFSIKDKIGEIKDQGASSSCVAQAFSYYAEVLNFVETGEKIKLSPRDIYSLIHLEEGGAYIRDGAEKITKSGIVLEADALSYQNEKSPTEEFMKSREDITATEIEKGKTYLAKKYATWNAKDFETYKLAIYQNNGCVGGAYGNNTCWQNAIIEVPDITNWAHALCFTGWKKIDGAEYIEFVNSWGKTWGDCGFGFLPKEYFEKNLVFNPTTLVDANNNFYASAGTMVSVLQKLIELYRKWITIK